SEDHWARAAFSGVRWERMTSELSPVNI
ncbi:MAG: hypothetical protein ACD_19C00134G0004, partial [uncultured bacterium]